MLSALIFKRLFAVSLVLLALFVWSCEDSSSDSDSGPETLMELDSRKLQSSGEFEFSIDSFIKDDYFILENGELATDQFADFWSGVAVRWGLRQKTADGEATDEAEESSSEDSSEAADAIPETFWLQRSENYSDEGDATVYQVTATEGEKQFFVLKPQNLNSYLPFELASIPVEDLEVVAETFQAAQTAEGQFQATASIELPADFSTDVARSKIYWAKGTTGFVLNQDERDAARTLKLAPTPVPVGADVTVAVSVEGAAAWVNEFTYEWQVLDAQGKKLDIPGEADQTSASFTFMAVNPGVNTVKVVVRDNADGTAMAVRRFDVQAAPGGLRIVKPSGSQTLQLAGGQRPNMGFEAEVGDRGNADLSYTWKLHAQDDNGGLSAGKEIGTGAILEYDFFEAAGRYVIKVEAQDGHGQVAQPAAAGANSVEVRLNAQPVASFTKPTAGDFGTATVGNAVNFAVTVRDEESSDFSYQWDYQKRGDSGWTAFEGVPNANAFALDTKDLALGSYNVRVNVTDEHGGRAEAVYQLSLEANDAPRNLRFDPVVTTVKDDEWLQLANLDADTEQTFQVLAEDENVAGLKYKWDINRKNQGIRGSQATLKLHSPLGKDQTQIDNDGHKVQVQVTVTDEMGNSESIHRTLYVNVAPDKPQITPTEISRTEYKFALAKVKDAEGDLITAYEWQRKGPGESEFVGMAGDDAQTGAVTLAEGQHQIRARIQDERGGWSAWSVALTVNVGPNQASGLKHPGGKVKTDDTVFQLANVDAGTAEQEFTVVGSDPDKGDTLTYVWKVNGVEQKKTNEPTAELVLYSPLNEGHTPMDANDLHKVQVQVTAVDSYKKESNTLEWTRYVDVAPKIVNFRGKQSTWDNKGSWLQLAKISDGVNLKFEVKAEDPDDDTPLNYAWKVNDEIPEPEDIQIKRTESSIQTVELKLYSPMNKAKGIQNKSETDSDKKRHKLVVSVSASDGMANSSEITRTLHVNVKPEFPALLTFTELSKFPSLKTVHKVELTPLTDPDGDKLIFNWKYEGFPNIVCKPENPNQLLEHSKAVIVTLERLDNSAPRVQNTVTVWAEDEYGGKMETESKMSWYS